MNNAWAASSLSGFTGASIVTNTATATAAGVTDPISGKKAQYVLAKTFVKVNPFFTLPSMPLINSLQIDGLTRPVTFGYSDNVPIEETGVD